MNISIFGLGYVGAVTAACLARRGHCVVGVDVQGQKVECFNQGVPPIIEPGLEELMREGRSRGLLRATRDVAEAIAATEVSVICVGTPSTVTGSLELGYVRQVLREIGVALAGVDRPHALVIRSTMLPGSTEALVGETLAALEQAGRVAVYYHPEFLREGTAVADFEQPSLAVVGTRDGRRPPAGLLSEIFGVEAAVVNWATAEMVKYACNAFHAAKITFANEIGRAGKELGIDSRAVMELVCRDTKLNLSPYYLKPGNPFGGSCLPKDVRALMHHVRVHGLSLPMLENLLPSNQRHLETLLGRILASGQREVVILGLSFKANTDDLRESAMVEVAQTLLGRGYPVRIYDPALNLAALVGSNKRVIDTRMPHLASLLARDLATALGSEGLVVVAQRCVSVDELRRGVTSRHRVLDVNGWDALRELPCAYDGFCW